MGDKLATPIPVKKLSSMYIPGFAAPILERVELPRIPRVVLSSLSYPPYTPKHPLHLLISLRGFRRVAHPGLFLLNRAEQH
jgi:hypothetical protein